MKKSLLTLLLIANTKITYAAGSTPGVTEANRLAGGIFNDLMPIIVFVCITGCLIGYLFTDGQGAFGKIIKVLMVAAVLALLGSVLGWLFGWTFSF